MHIERWWVLEADGYEKPLLLDIFQVNSKTVNQYDLPFNYIINDVCSKSFKYETPKLFLEPFF
jgi:hypothetical protein